MGLEKILALKNNSQISDIMQEPTWTAPTLINSWVDEGSGLYYDVGYTKDKLGRVRLRGSIKSGTVSTVAFILPIGYRPSKIVQFAVFTGTTNTTGKIYISPSGSVTVGSFNTFIALDGIEFYAEG